MQDREATMPSVHAVGNDSVRSQNIFGQPLTIFGIPVDRETIFSDHKGIYRIRTEKRQRKLIVKSTFIKFFLHHEETIRCLTTGYSPVSIKEQLITGPAFLYFKKAIFIFTNKRILHVPTRFNRSQYGAVSQILYEDCARIIMKGRTLHVDYKNGRQEAFPYLGRQEKKKLRTLIAGVTLSPKEAGQLKSRVHLCPSCTHILQPGDKICETCKMKFKTPFKAKLFSLLIPGGGYFYSRFKIIATAAGLFETALMTVLVLQGLALHRGTPVALHWVALPAFALVLEKFVMAYHTQTLIQNVIPEKGDYAVRKI